MNGSHESPKNPESAFKFASSPSSNPFISVFTELKISTNVSITTRVHVQNYSKKNSFWSLHKLPDRPKKRELLFRCFLSNFKLITLINHSFQLFFTLLEPDSVLSGIIFLFKANSCWAGKSKTYLPINLDIQNSSPFFYLTTVLISLKQVWNKKSNNCRRNFDLNISRSHYCNIEPLNFQIIAINVDFSRYSTSFFSKLLRFAFTREGSTASFTLLKR